MTKNERTMTMEQFRSTPSLQKELADILSKPVMTQAIQCVINSVTGQLPANASPQIVNNRSYLRSGVEAAFGKLDELTTPAVEVRKPSKKTHIEIMGEWYEKSMLPPELREEPKAPVFS